MTEKREPRVNFTVRMPWALRQRCHEAAAKAGMSVNEWMLAAVSRETEPGNSQTPEEERRAVD